MSYDFLDLPFPQQLLAHRDPFSFRRKKTPKASAGFDDDDDEDGKDVAFPSTTAANLVGFSDISKLRDRGRYGGFDLLDSAPVIPMLETPADIAGRKKALNTEYRKAMTQQKKQMMNNIAKMNNMNNLYQHNHALLNPIGSEPPGAMGAPMAGPRLMSFNTGGPGYNPASDPRSMLLQLGRLPPFAPKPMGFPGGPGGPGVPLSPSGPPGGPMAMPRNQSMGNQMNPYNRNPSMGNQVNPYNRNQSMGNQMNPYNRNPGMGNPVNPYSRNPSMGNQQNPSNRNQSMGNRQNPYNRNQSMGHAVNPYNRNGSMTNIPNPMAAPNGPMANVPMPMGSRNGSMTNMANPMGGRNGSMTNVANPMGGRNGSMTNVANPMGGRNGSLTNMANPMGGRNGSMTNMANPMTGRTGSFTNMANPMAARNESMKNQQNPYVRSALPMANSSSANRGPQSPARTNSPAKTQSPARASTPTRPQTQDSPSRNFTPRKAETPLRNNPLPMRKDAPLPPPPNEKLSNVLTEGAGRGKLKDFLLDDDTNPYDSLPKRHNNLMEYKSNRISMDRSSDRIYDRLDGYLENIKDENEDDMNFLAFDLVKKGGSFVGQGNQQPDSNEREKKDGFLNSSRLSFSDDEGDNYLPRPVATTPKKPVKKKPPTLPSVYEPQNPKSENKKNDFMAKLEASIDDSIGPENTTNTLSVSKEAYDYSARMSRSNFKTILLPELGDSDGVFENRQDQVHPQPSVEQSLNEKSSTLSSEEARNETGRNSGIASGFLKKLGFKKSGTKEKRKLKRESKLNSKKSAESQSASSGNTNIGGFNQRMLRESILEDTFDTSYSHDIYLDSKFKTDLDFKEFKKGKNESKIDERALKEKEERERLKKERIEKERVEKERAQRGNAEKERVEAEKAEMARVERERAEKEKADRERAQVEKARRKTETEGENQILKGLDNSREALPLAKALPLDLEDKLFGETLSGAFEDIGLKFGHDLDSSEAEIAAKAAVESEYMKMDTKMQSNHRSPQKPELYKALKYDTNSSSSTATVSAKEKKQIPHSSRLNLLVEQMGIIEANQALINELQLMTKELTDLIQREVRLENDLRTVKMGLSEYTGPSDAEKVELELREKLLAILRLMADFNEERKHRKIAEEHVLLWESANNVAPSFLDLSYENSRLQLQLMEKQEQINQQQQMIFQFDADKKALEDSHKSVERENEKYRNTVIPDLTNELEMVKNSQYQQSKKFQEQVAQLKEQNQDLQIKLRNYETGVVTSPNQASLNATVNSELEEQRNALREALNNLKLAKDNELRASQERIETLENKVEKLTMLNEKLQEKLLS